MPGNATDPQGVYKFDLDSTVNLNELPPVKYVSNSPSALAPSPPDWSAEYIVRPTVPRTITSALRRNKIPLPTQRQRDELRSQICMAEAPIREGSHSLRFILAKGDPPIANGSRAELSAA